LPSLLEQAAMPIADSAINARSATRDRVMPRALEVVMFDSLENSWSAMLKTESRPKLGFRNAY
jgi:hypothetical protein